MARTCKHYFEVFVGYSEEDKDYMAHSPQVKNCSGFGSSITEAMMEYGTALSLMMKVDLEEAEKLRIHPDQL